MALRRATPYKHAPMGVTDALDGTNVQPGAMVLLTNLVPDPTTKDLWYCRPAATIKTNFAGFSSPGFVSALKVVGTIAYGMVASARFTGKDEPFVYNILTGAFITVSGVTNANTPNSPPSTGAWVPPTIDVIGVDVVVTHPGFTGAGGNYFGWIDITNPAAPVWNAGNTGGTPLPSPPTAVRQFSGRAYYAVGNALYLSDALVATMISNASNILICGDNVPITALGGLPLNNTVTGGVVQSLMAFKGVSAIWQITGDPITSDLAQNGLNIATGTLAPNSVTPTPKGLAFISPEGLRYISFTAEVSDPVGIGGGGITVPFINSAVPSRICASYNANVIRVSTQNANAQGAPQQEYWFDLARGIWSGPHSFPASLISPYLGTFIITPVSHTAALFQSDVVQNSSSVFVEDGTQMMFDWRTVNLPDTGEMAVNAMVETTIRLALVSGVSAYTVRAIDQNETILDTVSVAISGAPSLWGGFFWGVGLWQGGQSALAPRQIKWDIPIVFDVVSIRLTGTCSTGFKIGSLFMRYQIQKYLLETP